MSITTRVMLAVAIAALVATTALLWGMHVVGREAADARLALVVTNVMESGGRERCEANPARFAERSRVPRRMQRLARRERVPGPPLRSLSVHTVLGVSATGGAPLSPRVLALLESADIATEGDRSYVRMAWTEGPCAVVGVARPDDVLGLGWRAWVLALAVLGCTLLASVLALRSPLRRLSLLSQAATQLGDTGFQTRTKLDEAARLGAPDEVGQLTSRMRDAVDRIAKDAAALAARDAALTEYVTHITHDLMTPVTALMQHLALLEEASREGRSASPETVAEAMRETHYLTQLVSNLGVIARVDASERIMQKRDVDLRDVVERVAARHAPLARAHPISLEHSVPNAPVMAHVDELLLERALGNLVSNAIRHHRRRPGQEEGHVALVLSTKGARFALRVLDDGAEGAGQAARIQKLFEQADETSRARSRTHGFGIEVVRKVALAHDFSVKAAPGADGGLEVTIEGGMR